MKPKQKVDIASSIIFILMGSFLLLCPLIQFTNLNVLFIIAMSCYAITSFGKFLLTKEYRDYEGLLSALSSLLIGSTALFYHINDNPANLALLLFGWIILESFIKLKKADYYHDRKSNLWILEISFLVLFILMGILTSINLDYENDTKVLLLGYFFFTHGILEFIDPIIIYLTKEKIKK